MLVLRTSHLFWSLKTKRPEQLSKRDFNPRLFSNTFSIVFQKSNKIDLKESESFKSASLTRKSLFREEFKDKERTKRSLRQLPTRTKIKVSSR